MTTTAYIALGSNVGERRAHLDRAVMLLRVQHRIEVTRLSAYHETEPVGGPPGQGAYLNAALEILTDLTARELLELLLDVERKLGRVRKERYGPRTLDLDILLFGDLITNEPDLTIPHPRMHERLFVLMPLVEIAPLAVHPVSGLTARQMLDELCKPRVGRPAPAIESGRGASLGNDLQGLRALVTGSTSGIGKAIALELAGGGADVLVHGKRAHDSARSAPEQIVALGRRSEFILADLSDPSQCSRLVERAWDEWNGLDVWINNAGADTLTGEAAHWSFERKLAELTAVDVVGTIVLSRAIGARMKARGSGVIVNMGWDQAETGMEGDSGQLFGASKAAVMAFTKSLALSLAPQVRVNCLAPGWIRTAWGESASEAWQARVLSETPLARWGTPEDVARAARWLVSPQAAFITGQIIRVNGGAVR